MNAQDQKIISEKKDLLDKLFDSHRRTTESLSAYLNFSEYNRRKKERSRSKGDENE